MTFTKYFLFAVIVKLVSAQVISYVPRNSIPQALEPTTRYVANVANTLNNAIPTSSNGNTVARVAAMPIANSAVAATANQLPASNANMNAVNAAINQNLASNYAASQNLANTNYVAKNANAAAQTAANALVSNAVATNANQNLALAANAVPATVATVANNVLNTNVNNAALANAALSNINGNMATFNLGTNGNTFTVTSGSPGAQGFGISVIADALEVGGTVAVNGQIPIFGTVAVNGNVPTDGAASVNYNCGGKQVPLAL